MTLLKDHSYLGKVGPGEMVFERRRYKKSEDGGATGALTIFTANDDLILTHFSATVKTTCTSGGSATLKVGPTGDDDKFMTTTQGAVGGLTAGAVVFPIPVLTEGTPNTFAAPLPWKLAAAETIVQTIGTDTFTAGVIEYCVGYINA